MAEVRCFLIERTGHTRRYLRRYSDPRPDAESNVRQTCAGGYHSAAVEIEPHLELGLYEVIEGRNGKPLSVKMTDPRWPVKCRLCAYIFAEIDHWQLMPQHEFHDPKDSGKGTFVWREDAHFGQPAPVGSMMYADWLQSIEHWCGPDGKVLVVVTPGGMWIIDGPDSSNNRPWTRTGTPPDVTVTPSIVMGGYHGFLTNGILRDC